MDFGALNLDLIQLSALMGSSVIPLVNSILQQDWFDRRVNTVIRLVVSVAAAAIMAWSQNDFDPADILASLITTLVAAQSIYHQLLGGSASGIGPAIQSATTIGGPKRADGDPDLDIDTMVGLEDGADDPEGELGPADVTRADRPEGGWAWEGDEREHSDAFQPPPEQGR